MTTLWAHQKQAADFVEAIGHGMLGMDVGTGKSLTLLELLRRWDCRRVLIVCPLGMVPVWPTQFEKHGFEEWRTVALATGSTKARAKQLYVADQSAGFNDRKLAVIINYDAVIADAMVSELKHVEWDCIAVDESQNLKGATGKTSKFIAHLASRCPHVVGLTGTPIHDKPVDVFGQLRTVAPEVFGDNYYKFLALYTKTAAEELKDELPKHAARELAVLEKLKPPLGQDRKFAEEKYGRVIAARIDSGQWPPTEVERPRILEIIGQNYYQWRLKKAPFMRQMVTGTKNMDEFKQKLATVTFTCNKREVLDLPPVLHENRVCHLAPATRKVYEEFASMTRREGGDILVRGTRLRQILSGFVKRDGEEVAVGTEKADLLAEVLSEYPEDEPIVVFAEFRHDFDVIHAAAKACGRTSSELSGPRKEREEWVAGKTNLLAVQYQSGGAGVDLTRACYMVIFTHPWSHGDYEQALGRIDRAGQERPVTVTHLVVADTIEQRVLKALSEKRNVADEIMDALGSAKGEETPVGGEQAVLPL